MHLTPMRCCGMSLAASRKGWPVIARWLQLLHQGLCSRHAEPCETYIKVSSTCDAVTQDTVELSVHAVE